MKKKTVYVGYMDYLVQSCGITELGQFSPHDATGWYDPVELDSLGAPAGAGWIIAAFTPAKEIYKEAYRQLAKKYKIVYQSPVRINTRTGSQFFFCIYDAKATS